MLIRHGNRYIEVEFELLDLGHPGTRYDPPEGPEFRILSAEADDGEPVDWDDLAESSALWDAVCDAAACARDWAEDARYGEDDR